MTIKVVEGVVMRANEKQVNTARGPATVFSALINEGTGESWYNFGFKSPNLSQNQVVKFTANARTYTNAQGVDVVTWDGDSATVQTVKTAEAAAPAVMAKAVVSVDNRQRSIVYQSAYERAILLVSGAVANDALPLPTKKGDRFDVYRGLVEEIALELAEKFINPPVNFVVNDPVAEEVTSSTDEYAVV